MSDSKPTIAIRKLKTPQEFETHVAETKRKQERINAVNDFIDLINEHLLRTTTVAYPLKFDFHMSSASKNRLDTSDEIMLRIALESAYWILVEIRYTAFNGISSISIKPMEKD